MLTRIFGTQDRETECHQMQEELPAASSLVPARVCYCSCSCSCTAHLSPCASNDCWPGEVSSEDFHPADNKVHFLLALSLSSSLPPSSIPIASLVPSWHMEGPSAFPSPLSSTSIKPPASMSLSPTPFPRTSILPIPHLSSLFPLPLTFLLSCVSWGIASRMQLPSELGFKPRSDVMMAFSMAWMLT